MSLTSGAAALQNTATHVELVSKDGEVYRVEIAVAKKMNVVKNALELFPDDEHPQPVNLSKVRSQILVKVLAWCARHRNDPDSDSKVNASVASRDQRDWDRELLNVDTGTLAEIIMAADFLDVPGLLSAACETVAKMMVEMTTVEQVRDLFGVSNDLSTEEEEKILRETAWCKPHGEN